LEENVGNCQIDSNSELWQQAPGKQETRLREWFCPRRVRLFTMLPSFGFSLREPVRQSGSDERGRLAVRRLASAFPPDRGRKLRRRNRLRWSWARRGKVQSLCWI